MSNEDYHLRLQPGDDTSTEDGDVRPRLLRIPGIEDQGDGLFHFGQPDADGVMQIRLADEHIQMVIPRPWVHERGPQVFALVFMVAEWRGWEVFDPQIGETLQKEAVLQGLVAMRQAQRNAEAAGDPGAVRSQAPPPPEGVKADPTDDLQAYRPRTSAPPPAQESDKKPWWKKLTGG